MLMQNHSNNISKQSNKKYISTSHSLDEINIDVDYTNHTQQLSVINVIAHSSPTIPAIITKDVIVNATPSASKCTCMLIGLCFNRGIISKLKDNEMNNIVHLVDSKGKLYNQSVVRDTWRCQAIEHNYCNTSVVTCSILSDSYRYLEDETNMNCDCNSTRFV